MSANGPLSICNMFLKCVLNDNAIAKFVVKMKVSYSSF